MFFVDGTIEKITIPFDSSSTDLSNKNRKSYNKRLLTNRNKIQR